MIWGCNDMVVPESIQQALGGSDAFERAMQLEGKIYRDVPGRRTMRVEIAGKPYFVKLHFGVGWREIFKNLLAFRLPILSALTEWRAIKRLNELGVPTTPAVAYGCRGSSPATLRSFLLTEDLGDIVSLEDYCRDWAATPPPLAVKRKLIRMVADIARTIHDNGLFHRDFYFCHLSLDPEKLAAGEFHLYLVDLHRMQVSARTSNSARIKDMAGLYFTALDSGLSRRDCLRFLRLYRAEPLPTLFRNERDFWKSVDTRARKLYFKFHRRWPVTPFDENRK